MPPEAELQWWYQYYFATERGQAGYDEVPARVREAHLADCVAAVEVRRRNLRAQRRVLRQSRSRRDRDPQLPLAAWARRRRARVRRARGAARRGAGDRGARRSRSRATPTARRIRTRGLRQEVLRAVRTSDDRGRHRAQPSPGGSAGVRRAVLDVEPWIVSLFSNLRSSARFPSRGTCPASTGRPAGSTRRHSPMPTCRERSCSPTSGPTPASTGCGRSPTSAPGPSDTRIMDWSWSASTRPSSRSSGTSTTCGAPRRTCASTTRSRSTATTRSGGRSRTTTGRPCTSPTRKAGSGITTSARADTQSARWSSSVCCARPDATASPTTSRPSRRRGSRPRPTGRTWSRPRATWATSKAGASRSAEGVALDEPRTYTAPDTLRLNQWALAGEWTIERRACVLDRADGRIAFRFHARDVNLVMGPSTRGSSVPFRVLVDGEPPGEAHGLDVDEQGQGSGRRAAAVPAHPPARTDRRPDVRDRLCRARRRGVRVHVRLGRSSTRRALAPGG